MRVSRIAVAVVALFAATLLACGSEEAAPTTTVQEAPAERDTVTVESEDGSAVLSIPAGALPEGVTLKDIEIREVSADPDLFVATEGDPPLAVLRLEPDGLQFSEPVTLTVQLQIEDPSGQIFAIHVFGDEAEMITDVESEFDPESNTLTASIQLRYFSDVWFSLLENVFEVEVSASASEVPVGGAFEVTVTVTRAAEPEQPFRARITSTAEFYIRLADAPWELEGYMSSFTPISPGVVESIPSATTVSTRTFTVRVEFECTSVGNAHVRYSGTVRFQTHETLVMRTTGNTLMSERET